MLGLVKVDLPWDPSGSTSPSGSSMRVIFFSSEMASKSFRRKDDMARRAAKRRGQTEEEKRDAMSHKGQRNQKWKAEQMDEAQKLLKQNDDLPDNKKLSYRAIARQTGVPVTTIIERLSGRRKGRGHIAGGARKARVLSDGKFKRVIKVGQNNRNCNRFNQTFNRSCKRVTKRVISFGSCTSDPLDIMILFCAF